MTNRGTFSEIVDSLLDLTSKVSAAPEQIEKLRQQINLFQQYTVHRRPPRIMIIGRRGAGKSSLINAILGERVADTGAVLAKTGRSQYYSYKSSKGSIDILDTRGLGDRTKPETANFQNAMDDIKSTIDKDYPDVILFLCKAKDADSYIEMDVKNVAEICKYIRDKSKINVPVVGVVTNIDELEPKRLEPPYDHPKKQENIDIAINQVKKALAVVITVPKREEEEFKVIGTSAYTEYDENGKIAYQNYWHIDVLLNHLFEILPDSTKLELARLSQNHKAEQNRFARVIVDVTSGIAGTVAVIPLPFGDVFPITAAQIGMISAIAYISGRDVSLKSAGEFLGAVGINIGLGIALREAARQIVKLVPVLGNGISGVIASSGTKLLGEVAIAYYIQEKSIDEVKQKFQKGIKEIEEASKETDSDGAEK